MSAWKISYTPEAREDLYEFDSGQRAQIFKLVERVSQNPLPYTEGGYDRGRVGEDGEPGDEVERYRSERSITMENERLTWDEIVKRYPDKWVGMSKIDWEDEANVRSAVVLGASDDGDEFLERQFSGDDVYTRYTTPDNLCPLGLLVSAS